MAKTAKKSGEKTPRWTHWPSPVFYLPLVFWWVKYWFKSGSVWYLSASNPTLTFGGFEGETKEEMYQQLPAWSFPPTVYVRTGESIDTIIGKLKEQSITFPFAAKPNKGTSGILFRKIYNEQQLGFYHQKAGVDYIIQQFVDYPVELGVFYYRHPSESKGQITAVVQKYFPFIKGDGHSSLQKLIQDLSLSPALSQKLELENFEKLNHILPPGEQYQLSHIANRYHGSEFLNVTGNREKLLAVFDKLSLHSNSFFYGRYDLKCQSLHDLEEGQNFYILEFNGAGSIPNQIYGGGFGLLSAYREILRHWKLLYEVSIYNHSRGIPYLSLAQGLKVFLETRSHFRRLKKVDLELRYVEK